MASSPFVAGLQAAARAHDIAINVGVHDPEPASAGPARLYNRTIHIEASGELLVPATYTKLHLFDFPAAGLVESAHTAPGAALAPPFATAVGRIGALVCFDLRFAEAALALAQPGPGSAWRDAPAQLLTYPSAFTVPTGRAHWELLLRARAVEAQAFVVAAAQVGRHHDVGRGRVSYGRSMVVDPWGTVLCALGAAGEDGTVDDGAVGQLGVVDIDLALWEDVRAKMPLVRRRWVASHGFRS